MFLQSIKWPLVNMFRVFPVLYAMLFKSATDLPHAFLFTFSGILSDLSYVGMDFLVGECMISNIATTRLTTT